MIQLTGINVRTFKCIEFKRKVLPPDPPLQRKMKIKKEKLIKKRKDPLDKIFVDYHKSIVKNKFGQWEFKKIDVEFIDFLNSWGDFDKHKECLKENKRTEFGEGYKQAIRDIMGKLKPDWRRFDKRTKTGLEKQ